MRPATATLTVVLPLPIGPLRTTSSGFMSAERPHPREQLLRDELRVLHRIRAAEHHDLLGEAGLQVRLRGLHRFVDGVEAELDRAADGARIAADRCAMLVEDLREGDGLLHLA